MNLLTNSLLTSLRYRFFINTSYLYERLVRTYSAPPPSLSKISTSYDEPHERTSLLTAQARVELSNAEADFVSMEVQLQMTLIRVRPFLFRISSVSLMLPHYRSLAYLLQLLTNLDLKVLSRSPPIVKSSFRVKLYSTLSRLSLE